jgi:hypothetical protein
MVQALPLTLTVSPTQSQLFVEYDIFDDAFIRQPDDCRSLIVREKFHASDGRLTWK